MHLKMYFEEEERLNSNEELATKCGHRPKYLLGRIKLELMMVSIC